ncbi:MAG: glycosyltransferase family 2 protein [bacterium]|jgi:glycosyltransferase involved in cell wall biosynthesis
MPVDQVRLSITIPTFNRAECLRECLESIRVALSSVQAKGQCEVVISDNDSTDHTGLVVKAFEKDIRIRYFRQSTNIGAHANFRAVAALANGTYVWILGDDDKIVPEAVRKILEGLEKGIGAVVCNVSIYDHSFSRVIRPRFIEVSENIIFNEPDQVLAKLGIHVGYISGVILNRQAFLNVPLADYQRFDQGGSCFMYAAYLVLRASGRVLFLAEPLVMNRGGEGESQYFGDGDSAASPLDRWWITTFAVGFPQALAALQPCGYSFRAIRTAYAHTTLFYLLPRLMFLKNAGRPVRGLVREGVRNMAASWTVWCLLLPAAVMPGAVLRGLKFIKCRLVKWIKEESEHEPVDI